MLVIDPNLAQKYEVLLVQQDILINQRSYFYKWLSTVSLPWGT